MHGFLPSGFSRLCRLSIDSGYILLTQCETTHQLSHLTMLAINLHRPDSEITDPTFCGIGRYSWTIESATFVCNKGRHQESTTVLSERQSPSHPR